MSDDQILRALNLDPATSSARGAQGKNGQSTEYSAEADRVTITRSTVSGVSVMHGTQSWSLGKPLQLTRLRHWMAGFHIFYIAAVAGPPPGESDM